MPETDTSRPKREIVLVNRTEVAPRSLSDGAEQIAKIVSLIAVPIILGVGGWWIQNALSERSINKDYVQLAVTILTSSESDVDPSLRAWAVDLLNANSPVKLDEQVAEKLLTGEVSLPRAPFISPASNFELLSNYAADSGLRRMSRSIGRLDVRFAGGLFTTCTATLISENTLLTALHCLSVKGQDGSAVEASLLMGYYDTTDTISTQRYQVNVEALESSEADDYAILRTDGTPGDQWGYVTIVAREPQPGEPLLVVHHPAARPKHVSRGACRVIKLLGPVEFVHSCDTLPGSGGAPIFSEDGVLLGFHYAKEHDTGHGIAKRITAILKKSRVLEKSR